MNKQLLKLLWNRRKDYIWIFVEQILVFIVLVYFFTLFFTKWEQFTDPGNLSTKGVMTFAIIPNHNAIGSDEEKTMLWKNHDFLEEKVRQSDLVEVVHRGYYSIPGNRSSRLNFQDSLIYNNKKYKFYIKTSDDKFPIVFKPNMITGTWFKDEAFDDGYYPVVITRSVAEKLELNDPIGGIISYENRNFRVTGVMHDFKTFIYDETAPTAIFASSAFKDTNMDYNAETAALVKKGQEKAFVNFYWKEVMKLYPNLEHQPFAGSLEDSDRSSNIRILTDLLAIAIPAIFFIVFAFLGTFSLMYKESQNQLGEYGLRVAIGSTPKRLMRMVLWQGCLITVIAVIPGVIIGINMYLLLFPEASFLLFLKSMITAIILILSFALISIWWPARNVSKIQPAIALKHEE